MSKEEFFSGQQFSLLGIAFDLQFDPNTCKLHVNVGQNTEYTTYVEPVSNVSFVALLTVFGVSQVVEVRYSNCELK